LNIGTMEKGFFGSLLDISFTSLVATKVIKVLYVLSIVLIGLMALVFVVSAFTQSVGAGIFTLLIVAPLAALLYLIYVRVILEVIICIFRIMETNVELVGLQRAATGQPTPPPPPPGPTVHDPEPPSSMPPPHPA
jgi:uncharacterized protein DUF4282